MTAPTDRPGGQAALRSPRVTRGVGRLLASVAVIATTLSSAGCSHGAAAAADNAPCVTHQVEGQGALCTGTGHLVNVIVRNFGIVLPKVIPTGKVTFVVRGVGPTLHEFNVAKSTRDPKKLELAGDDTVADTVPMSGFTFIAQVEGIDVGMTKTLTTNITAGHYVFYCNMDGHYMAGMSAQAVAE
jgi:Sulfocyanin (SoxE) domain